MCERRAHTEFEKLICHWFAKAAVPPTTLLSCVVYMQNNTKLLVQTQPLHTSTYTVPNNSSCQPAQLPSCMRSSIVCSAEANSSLTIPRLLTSIKSNKPQISSTRPLPIYMVHNCCGHACLQLAACMCADALHCLACATWHLDHGHMGPTDHHCSKPTNASALTVQLPTGSAAPVTESH